MTRRIKYLRPILATVLLAVAACGGGGTSPTPPNPPPPPPPPPAPVATIVVDPPTASLVPPQTQPLTATVKDAAGNVLAGRTVTWSTSAGAVATVSAAGLVTAAGAGSATITATSEGKTGTSVIAVADGAQVPTTGGTVNAAGGNVTITVPAGAVSAPVTISVAPATTVPGDPAGAWGVDGTKYVFSPEGTTFTTPVTVTMKYDPAKVPAWVIPSDFALYHYTGGAWVKFTNITVDAVAHTITGQTTGFSPVQAAITIPSVILQPDPAFVTINQRSVVVTATLFNHPTTFGLTYDFSSSSAKNGVVTQLLPTDNTAQYTMTQPSLPSGDLDVVLVRVMGRPNPSQPTIAALGFATATVNSSPTYTFELNPEFNKPGFGQTVNLQAVVRDKNGAVFVNTTDNFIQYAWRRTSNFGDLDIPSGAPQNSFNAVYTAKLASMVPHLNPRADQIDVDFWMTAPEVTNPNTNPPTTIPVTTMVGHMTAFVDVAPKTSFGTFTVKQSFPSTASECNAAVVLIPKVTGAPSYSVQVTGISQSSLGSSVTKTVTGPTHTGSILDVYDAGANLGVPLDGGCNTDPVQAHNRQLLYQRQFLNATILSTVP